MAVTSSIGSAARPRDFMARVLRPFGVAAGGAEKAEEQSEPAAQDAKKPPLPPERAKGDEP